MKSRAGLLAEVRKMFPGREVTPLGHRGNSSLFAAGGMIIKYLPKSGLEKYLEVYRLLSGRSGIKLPKIIKIAGSEVSDSCLVAMERIEGTPLTDLWEGLPETGKKLVVRQFVRTLKQFHSVRFPGTIPPHFRPGSGVPDWKKEVYDSCFTELEHCRKNKFIGRNLHGVLLSFLKGNIGAVPAAGYVLLHRDLNFNNVMAGKDLELTLLFDFETCTAGDKYLDLVANGVFFEEKYRELLFELYGVPRNFKKLSGVYRLLAILCFLRTKKIQKGKEAGIAEFIKTGRSHGASPVAWIR